MLARLFYRTREQRGSVNNSETKLRLSAPNRSTDIMVQSNHQRVQSTILLEGGDNHGSIEFVRRHEDFAALVHTAADEILKLPELDPAIRNFVLCAQNSIESSPVFVLRAALNGLESRQLTFDPNIAFLLGVIYAYADISSNPEDANFLAQRYFEAAKHSRIPFVNSKSERILRELEGNEPQVDADMRTDSVFSPRDKNRIDKHKKCISPVRMR